MKNYFSEPIGKRITHNFNLMVFENRLNQEESLDLDLFLVKNSSLFLELDRNIMGDYSTQLGGLIIFNHQKSIKLN